MVHLAPQERRWPFPPLWILLSGPRGELIIANIYSGLVTARSGE